MSFKSKIKHVSLAVVILVGFAILALGNYKERNSYRCRVCFSRLNKYQWRLGSWPENSFPLSSKWQETNLSAFANDFFQSNHIHEWKFEQGSPYYFFGTKWGGCALGWRGHETDFLQSYELSPDFRDFIRAKLRKGAISCSNVIEMANPEKFTIGSPAHKCSDALLAEYYAK